MEQCDIYISVIIPNYCHSLFLDQRIQSILNQTYQNFELIILDDCSPDNGASWTIIEKYKNNPHVSHVIYNVKNSGSTFIQWNKGISIAKGEYIWIAESDDFCEKNMLELLVSQIILHSNVALVYALSQNVNKDGQIIGRHLESHNDRFLSGHDFITKYMCCENPVYNASAALFKREAALNIKPLYLEFKGAGDRLFWIEIAEKGNVVVVNKPLSYFRQHDNKVTPQKSLDGTNLKEAYKIYLYLKDVFKLDRLHRYLSLGYYRYLVLTGKFNSKNTQNELFSLWNFKQNSCKLQMLLGRIYVALRYRYNLYL